MANGELWQLPDGRRAIETGRTARLLRAVPISEDPPFMGESVLVWRADCTPLPSRYLHGQVHHQPAGPDLA